MASDTSSGTLTEAFAGWVSSFSPSLLPEAVRAKTVDVVLDGTAAILAATDPALSTGSLIGEFCERQGGKGAASLIGRGVTTDPVSAALANGTLGYACDVEPFHPEAVLHPIAAILPAALAVAEHVGAGGADHAGRDRARLRGRIPRVDGAGAGGAIQSRFPSLGGLRRVRNDGGGVSPAQAVPGRGRACVRPGGMPGLRPDGVGKRSDRERAAVPDGHGRAQRADRGVPRAGRFRRSARHLRPRPYHLRRVQPEAVARSSRQGPRRTL